MKNIIRVCVLSIGTLGAMEKDRKIELNAPPPSQRKKTKTERLARLTAKYSKPLAEKIAKSGPNVPTNFFFRAQLTDDPKKKRELEEQGSKSSAPSPTGKFLAKRNFNRLIAEARPEWENAYRMQKEGAVDAQLSLRNFEALLGKASFHYREKHRFDSDGHEAANEELDRLAAIKINKVLSTWYLERASLEWRSIDLSSYDNQLALLKDTQDHYLAHLIAKNPNKSLESLVQEVNQQSYQALYDWNLEKAKAAWISLLKEEKKNGDLGNGEKFLLVGALWFYAKQIKNDESDLEEDEVETRVEIHANELIYQWHLDAVREVITMKYFDFDQAAPYNIFLASTECDQLFTNAQVAYRRYVKSKHPESEDKEIDEHVTQEFEALKASIKARAKAKK